MAVMSRRAQWTADEARSIRPHGTAARVLVPADASTWSDLEPCTGGHSLLYRFRDADGRLLYIGVTALPKTRWKSHRKTKAWWMDVASVRIECHVSDHEVHIAEYAAIGSEQPMHNKHGVVRL